VIGIFTKASQYNVRETMDKLVLSLLKMDVVIYARINRQLEQKWFGRQALPFEYILCDSPEITGLSVELNPLKAFELPAVVIVWEDSEKRCWVACKKQPDANKTADPGPGDMLSQILETAIRGVLSTGSS